MEPIDMSLDDIIRSSQQQKKMAKAAKPSAPLSSKPQKKKPRSAFAENTGQRVHAQGVKPGKLSGAKEKRTISVQGKGKAARMNATAKARAMQIDDTHSASTKTTLAAKISEAKTREGMTGGGGSAVSKADSIKVIISGSTASRGRGGARARPRGRGIVKPGAVSKKVGATKRATGSSATSGQRLIVVGERKGRGRGAMHASGRDVTLSSRFGQK
ncbi:MAG: hypothetical protein SGPRY_007385 [Prymnesium sp.]